MNGENGDLEVQLAVLIVTHRSAGVIGSCLDSLLAATRPRMRIVVVDNASPDDTVDQVQSRVESAGRHRLELVRAPGNGGFAAGVNLGLDRLTQAGFVWILNPDCTVPPETPGRMLDAARSTPGFALMGGRTLFADPPNHVQTDGGRVGRWTGVCRLINGGADATVPAPQAGTLDFISGANMLASRAFLDRAGPMDEGYFLYYEEVDWARRRGDMPLALCPGAVVYHKAGSAIGSPAPGRRASAFSSYFNYRSRMRYVARHRPGALPVAAGFAIAKILYLVLQGALPEADGALRGILGLAPPRAVRRRLDPTAPGPATPRRAGA